MFNCPNCNAEMKLIPAGVSKKTNKPYNAFYSCGSCGTTHNPTPQPKSAPKPKKDMDKVWADKDRKMARMCSIKAAVEYSKVRPELGLEETIKVAKRFDSYIETDK